MPYQLGLPAALARRGLVVETVPGWETRGSSAFTPRAALCHWTAGPRGSTTRPSLNICINGRSDLPGPLCNVFLDRKGIAVVVAAGRSNHAGAGNWRGLTAGNSVMFGTEAECGGDGDWTPAQRVAYPKVNAAYCDLGKFGADMIGGHHEHAPTRKIDIRDWPMSAMRAQVAAILAGSPTIKPLTEDDDMTPEQDTRLKNIENILGGLQNAVGDPKVGILHQVNKAVGALIGGNPDGQNNFHWLEERIDQHVTELAASVAAGGGGAVDVDALVERIATGLRDRLQA